MMLELRIKNFRSYKDEAIFSFEARPEKALENNVIIRKYHYEKKRILKSACIFGPNAAGKSNIIWALDSLSFVVNNSLRFSPLQGTFIYAPFALNRISSKRECLISYKSLINGEIYTYTIEFGSSQFSKETLSKKKGNEESLIYSFSVEGISKNRKFVKGNAWNTEGVSLLEEPDKVLNENQLVLSLIGNRKSENLSLLYNEIVSMETEPFGGSLADIHNMHFVRHNDSVIKKRVSKLLNVADLGIVEILEETDKRRLKENKNVRDGMGEQEFLFVHKGKGHVEMPFIPSMESVGTLKLFKIASRILYALEVGSVVAYDEMDMAIHPDLFKLLIQLFNDPRSNPNNAQILFTCHTPSICEIMRADQIWFAQKNSSGESELYSAQDFDGVNITMPFENWYRNGKFGSLPTFKAIDYIFEDRNGASKS